MKEGSLEGTQSSTSTAPVPALLTSSQAPGCHCGFHRGVGERRDWLVPDSLPPENPFTPSLWWNIPGISFWRWETGRGRRKVSRPWVGGGLGC